MAALDPIHIASVLSAFSHLPATVTSCITGHIGDAVTQLLSESQTVFQFGTGKQLCVVSVYVW